MKEAYQAAGSLPSKASTKTHANIAKKRASSKTHTKTQEDKADAQTPQPHKSRTSEFIVSSIEKASKPCDDWWDEKILRTRIGRAHTGNIRTYLLGLTASSDKFRLITEITKKKR